MSGTKIGVYLIFSARALPPGVVDGIVAGEDQLGDGYKGIALLSELFQDGGQGLGGVEGRVMKENDGPRAYLAGHPLGDLVGGDLLPVQAVHIPLDGLHPDGPGGLHRLVVVVSVGHPNQRGPHPGDCLNFVVAGVEVSDHLVGGELRIVGVGVGVIHDLVSRVGKCFYRFRIFTQEKF